MDFDLGAGTTKMPAANVKTVAPEELEQKTQVLSTPMDFDITGSHTNMTAPTPENVETSEVQLDDLIFDVTDSHDAKSTNKDSRQSDQAAVPEEPEETISFLLDFPTKLEAAPSQAASNAAMDIGLAEINLNLDEIVPKPAPTPAPKPAPAPAPPTPEVASAVAAPEDDEVATKLDLAKAYQEMGDSNGAREILEEVVREGNEQQRAAAEALLQTLPA